MSKSTKTAARANAEYVRRIDRVIDHLFSRAFRAAYATAPSHFRKDGEIKKSKIRKDLFVKSKYLLAMSDADEHLPARFRHQGIRNDDELGETERNPF